MHKTCKKSATYLLEITAKKLNRKLEQFSVQPRNFTEKIWTLKNEKTEILVAENECFYAGNDIYIAELKAYTNI